MIACCVVVIYPQHSYVTLWVAKLGACTEWVGSCYSVILFPLCISSFIMLCVLVRLENVWLAYSTEFTWLTFALQECHPEQLFSESKFLQGEGLRELLKALVFASRGPEAHLTLGTVFDEDSAVFFLELLVSVALENKWEGSSVRVPWHLMGGAVAHVRGVVLN